MTVSLRFLALAAAVGLAPLSTRAATIDFRSSSFSAADNAASFSNTVSGVTTTLAPEPDRAKLYWDSTDGIGVRFDYETDEIEGVERLAISFSTPIRLTEIMLTDLFNENGYLETGWYQVNGGGQNWFSADPSQLLDSTNGVKLLALDQVTTTLRFGAPGLVNGQNHEFSVARIRFDAPTSSPVPEPASGLLTAVGGLIIGRAVRRRPQPAA
jgi:hypothetical protein